MSEALEYQIEVNTLTTFLVGALALVAIGDASLLAALHLGAVFLGLFGFFAIVISTAMTAYATALYRKGYCRDFLGRFVDWETPSLKERGRELEARDAFGGDA